MREGNSSVLSYADVLMYYNVETIHHGWIDSTFEKNNRLPELSEMMMLDICSSGCLCQLLDNSSGHSDEWRSYPDEHVISSV